MSGGFYGADVAALRALAKSVADAAAVLRSSAGEMSHDLQSSPWRGPDAARFRSDWSTVHAARIRTVGEALDRASRVLSGNADEQERTSVDTGAAAGSSAPTTGAGSPTAGVGTATAVPPAGTDPAAVTAWWNTLTPAQQSALIAGQPGVIGNLDGVPSAARDEANRIFLTQEIARVEALPGLPDRNAAAERARTLDALRAVQQTLADKPGTHLLLLDARSGDQVHAAIAVGDVDAADHVAVYTQGMNSGTEVENGVSAPVNDAVALQREVDSQLYESGDPGSIAVVVWMGYDSPQNAQVVSPAYGIDGARDLASFADGLRSTNPDAHLTALGHSYGSFVTGTALRLTDSFDDAVVFGSPGISTGNLDDLHIGSGNLYVLEADGDAVADLGYFGPDPNHIPGVTDLSSDPHDDMVGSSGHMEYLVDRSTSQYNIAAVVSGHPDDVVQGDNSGFGDWLRGTQKYGIDLPRTILGGVLDAR